MYKSWGNVEPRGFLFFGLIFVILGGSTGSLTLLICLILFIMSDNSNFWDVYNAMHRPGGIPNQKLLGSSMEEGKKNYSLFMARIYEVEDDESLKKYVDEWHKKLNNNA